ncbi:hypothetical protein J3458_021300 [Metarhizium acridum]|nr:hypothetical protein J3458_021300 [Metarhizium acridum]
MGDLVPRTSPLIDIRPLLSDPGYTAVGHLKSHGFGVVKHRSASLESCYTDKGEIDEEAAASAYYPEIKELVAKTLGAKYVHVTHSVFRRGARAPEPFKMPTGLKPLPSVTATGGSKQGDKETSTEKAEEKPTIQAQQSKPADYWSSRPRMSTSTPARVPHLDFTPISARRTLRFQSQEIYKTAVERGMIAAEDTICQNHPFRPSDKESDSLIAEQYNHSESGRLGPRYAAYSIWRPLKKVARDPLTFSPRKEMPVSADCGMVHWQYENKVPGPPELGGDWLKEFAMLGVKAKEVPPEQSPRHANTCSKWYYVSAQETDEVLFVQLFDSASLGVDSQHAGAPWHASPEIGAAAGDEPRESIDVRVVVLW